MKPDYSISTITRGIYAKQRDEFRSRDDHDRGDPNSITGVLQALMSAISPGIHSLLPNGIMMENHHIDALEQVMTQGGVAFERRPDREYGTKNHSILTVTEPG